MDRRLFYAVLGNLFHVDFQSEDSFLFEKPENFDWLFD